MKKRCELLGEQKEGRQDVRLCVAGIVKPLDQLPAAILPVAAADEIDPVFLCGDSCCLNIHSQNILSAAEAGKGILIGVARQFPCDNLHMLTHPFRLMLPPSATGRYRYLSSR